GVQVRIRQLIAEAWLERVQRADERIELALSFRIGIRREIGDGHAPVQAVAEALNVTVFVIGFVHRAGNDAHDPGPPDPLWEHLRGFLRYSVFISQRAPYQGTKG